MTAGTLFSSFEDAHALGLVNQVWTESDLSGRSRDALIDYAKQFTPPHRASQAVGHIKRAVQSGVEMSLANGLSLERELQQRLFESDDAKEGIAAHVEKRAPRFRATNGRYWSELQHRLSLDVQTLDIVDTLHQSRALIGR